jgi:anti-sigma B factor antagonist
MGLEIVASGSSRQHLIEVRGEVDLYSSPELRKAILDAVPTAEQGLSVDLSGVDYMDSSGVATLVEGLKSANSHAKYFRLVAPSNAVMSVLRLARLDALFEVRTEP